MALKSFTTFLIFALLLAGCGYPMPTMVPTMAENPTGSSTQTSAPTSYPGPVIVTVIPTSSIYPEPGTPGTGTPVIPTSGYEPQPGDNRMQRDQVQLDIVKDQLVVMTTQPTQAEAILTGSLSDPCHQLRVVVTPANIDKAIHLEVYSLYDPNVACITVIKPFSATIPLGSYAGGHYKVFVNDQLVGEFDG
jgi:hypothetical protein